MTRLFLKYIYIFAAYAFLVAAVPAPGRVSDVIEPLQNAIVTVSVLDKEGKNLATTSGFVVSPEGIVVTDCRIIATWYKRVENMLDIETKDGFRLPVEDIISMKCKNHLSVLKVKGGNLPAVTLAPDSTLDKKQRLWSIMRTSRSGGTPQEIRLTNVRKGNMLFEISVPVAPNESGFPLLNRKGEVIAVALSLPGKKKKGFAVSLQAIRQEIRKQKKIATASAPLSAPYRITVDKSNGLDIATEYFLYGCALEKMNMYGEALKLYQESLKLKPDLLDAYINLGKLNYKLGRYIDAIDSYTQALMIQPDLPDVYNKLGTAHLIRGEYAPACDAFQAALSIDPEDPVAHFNLGIVYFLTGDKTAAFEEYTILKNLDAARANNLKSVIR